MEKCRRMKSNCVCQRVVDISWLWMSSLTRQQYCRLESFAMKTGFLRMDQWSKTTSHEKTGFGYSAIRRTSFLSWFQACQRVRPPVLILQHQWHLQDRKMIILHLPQARLLHQPQLCEATVGLEREDQSGIDSSPVPVSSSHVEDMMELWDPFFAANTGSAPKPTKNLKPNKEETTIERRDPLFASKPAPLGSEMHDRNPEYRDTREFFSWTFFWSLREVWIWVNTVFIVTSWKTEIARSARGPKSQGPRAEDVVAEPYLVQKILVIWLQQITQFSMKVVNLETIIDIQSLCKTWIPNESSRIRAKQKLLRKHNRSLQKFLEPNRKPKVTYTDNSLEFGKACEDLSWNHIASTPHRSETNGIAERAVRRIWKRHLQYCFNQVWMKNGGRVPWSATAFCETLQISYLMGRRHTKDVLENHLKDRFFHVVHWLSITLLMRKTSQETINLEIKSYLECSLDTLCTREEIWNGDMMVADIEELRWTHRKSTRKDSMRKKWYFPKEKRGLYVSNRWWTNPNPWRRSGPENIHLGTGPPKKNIPSGQPGPRRRTRKSFWRIMVVFTTTSRLIAGWWWCKKWFLVHVWELHVPSSRWTESQTSHAERRIIPYFTTIHWRDQNNKHDLGCHAWTPHGRWLEYRRKPFVDWVHTIHHIGRKTSRWIFVVQVAVDEGTNDIHVWLLVAREMERHLRSLTSLEDWAVFASLIQKMRSSKKLSNVGGEKLEVPMPAAMLCQIMGNKVRRNSSHSWCSQGKNTNASLKPTNQWASVWKKLFKERSWRPHCRARNSSGQRIGKTRWCWHGSWQLSETKKDVIAEARKEGKPCISRHEWTSVISRNRNWNQKFKSTNVQREKPNNVWSDLKHLGNLWA